MDLIMLIKIVEEVERLKGLVILIDFIELEFYEYDVVCIVDEVKIVDLEIKQDEVYLLKVDEKVGQIRVIREVFMLFEMIGKFLNQVIG